jgi:hypothetical protein
MFDETEKRRMNSKQKKYSSLIKRPGVDVMTTIFYFSTIFDNFRRKD